MSLPRSSSSASMASTSSSSSSSTAPRSLLSHAAFSLNALSFFLAFLIVDCMTFPAAGPSAAPPPPAATAPATPRRFGLFGPRRRRTPSEEGRFLAVPAKSSSGLLRPVSPPASPRFTAAAAAAQPRTPAKGVFGFGRARAGSDIEVRELSRIRSEEELKERRGSGGKAALGHYQKKIFEKQVSVASAALIEQGKVEKLRRSASTIGPSIATPERLPSSPACLLAAQHALASLYLRFLLSLRRHC
jgi:hypothetical protein